MGSLWSGTSCHEVWMAMVSCPIWKCVRGRVPKGDPSTHGSCIYAVTLMEQGLDPLLGD